MSDLKSNTSLYLNIINYGRRASGKNDLTSPTSNNISKTNDSGTGWEKTYIYVKNNDDDSVTIGGYADDASAQKDGYTKVDLSDGLSFDELKALGVNVDDIKVLKIIGQGWKLEGGQTNDKAQIIEDDEAANFNQAVINYATARGLEYEEALALYFEKDTSFKSIDVVAQASNRSKSEVALMDATKDSKNTADFLGKTQISLGINDSNNPIILNTAQYIKDNGLDVTKEEDRRKAVRFVIKNAALSRGSKKTQTEVFKLKAPIETKYSGDMSLATIKQWAPGAKAYGEEGGGASIKTGPVSGKTAETPKPVSHFVKIEGGSTFEIQLSSDRKNYYVNVINDAGQKTEHFAQLTKTDGFQIIKTGNGLSDVAFLVDNEGKVIAVSKNTKINSMNPDDEGWVKLQNSDSNTSLGSAQTVKLVNEPSKDLNIESPKPIDSDEVVLGAELPITAEQAIENAEKLAEQGNFGDAISELEKYEGWKSNKNIKMLRKQYQSCQKSLEAVPIGQEQSVSDQILNDNISILSKLQKIPWAKRRFEVLKAEKARRAQAALDAKNPKPRYIKVDGIVFEFEVGNHGTIAKPAYHINYYWTPPQGERNGAADVYRKDTIILIKTINSKDYVFLINNKGEIVAFSNDKTVTSDQKDLKWIPVKNGGSINKDTPTEITSVDAKTVQTVEQVNPEQNVNKAKDLMKKGKYDEALKQLELIPAEKRSEEVKRLIEKLKNVLNGENVVKDADPPIGNIRVAIKAYEALLEEDFLKNNSVITKRLKALKTQLQKAERAEKQEIYKDAILEADKTLSALKAQGINEEYPEYVDIVNAKSALEQAYISGIDIAVPVKSLNNKVLVGRNAAEHEKLVRASYYQRRAQEAIKVTSALFEFDPQYKMINEEAVQLMASKDKMPPAEFENKVEALEKKILLAMSSIVKQYRMSVNSTTGIISFEADEKDWPRLQKLTGAIAFPAGTKAFDAALAEKLVFSFGSTKMTLETAHAKALNSGAFSAKLVCTFEIDSKNSVIIVRTYIVGEKIPADFYNTINSKGSYRFTYLPGTIPDDFPSMISWPISFEDSEQPL